ncbi:MAG: hypothetical protein BMS9Abin08_0043 [Gammaproteobacteria bacterium]|nr:MAG: hypothetical protein BMS9Abin08_0043 [Gammaproteobacteria bacterium]
MNRETIPRTVFARFTEDDILDEMGRLLYSILNIFATNGYRVELFDNINFSELDKYGQQVPSLDNLYLVDSVPDDSGDRLYLFDRVDKTCSKRRWKKKIQVKFDIFSTYRLTDPLIMPYPVHPLLSGTDLPQRLEQLRKNEKKLRIFFSGDTKGYTRNRIHYPNTKLPRLEVINTILEQRADRTIHVKDEATLKELLDGGFVDSCVIVNTGSMWIDPQEWLPDLSKSDFFICPPGYCMPMCHNVIEAMAVGSIPILNYPEWFNPTLSHMENCIIFDNREDLVTKIDHVLDMQPHEVAALRKRVIAYYEEHLGPRNFIDAIESREDCNITVLMITDKNTRKNASRLNRRSILITGKATFAGSWWYRVFRSFGVDR